MAEDLVSINLPNEHVVQIISGLGRPESEMHATDLCRRLSRRLNCKMTLLPAPGIVDEQYTRSVFLSDSHVQNAMNLFSQVGVAFVGIWAPSPDSLVMRDGSILKQSEIDELQKKGAVGDIALRYFDSFGQLVMSELDQRVIRMGPRDFSSMDRVVGVTGGPQKTDAILGALRGQLIDVLIADHSTAKRLLEKDPNMEKGKNYVRFRNLTLSA